MPIDYSKYPVNWKSEIVPRILDRANNKCEVCGLKNKQKVYSLNFYLRSNDNGRYGYKKVWVQNMEDAYRVKHITSGIKEIKVILTVAHLDHDELNHNVKDERLMAMCQYCHLNYDSKEKYKRACKQ